MKVILGGRKTYDVFDRTKLPQIENDLTNYMVHNIAANAVDLSPRLLRRMQERIKLAATEEANQIFDVIVDVIDKPRNTAFDAALRYTDLSQGKDFSGAKVALGGALRWDPLSYSYSLRKMRDRPRNAAKFFRYNDDLRNYFKGRGDSVIRSRLGGVQVSVDMSAPHNQAVYTRAGRQSWASTPVYAEQVSHIILGRVVLTVFPMLNPALAPGLSTRRWTDAGSGAMERQIFGGNQTVDKLVAHGYKRPLVAPVIQFFMLVRIPAAIRRNMANYFKRTGIAYD